MPAHSHRYTRWWDLHRYIPKWQNRSQDIGLLVPSVLSRSCILYLSCDEFRNCSRFLGMCRFNIGASTPPDCCLRTHMAQLGTPLPEGNRAPQLYASRVASSAIVGSIRGFHNGSSQVPSRVCIFRYFSGMGWVPTTTATPYRSRRNAVKVWM